MAPAANNKKGAQQTSRQKQQQQRSGNSNGQQQRTQQQQNANASSTTLRQQQQQQQQQPGSAADDDLLEAPPAFPQPVSSLPRSQQHYQQYAAAAPSPFVSSSGTAFPPTSSTSTPGLPISSSAASYTTPSAQLLLLQQPQQQQPWPPVSSALPSPTGGLGLASPPGAAGSATAAPAAPAAALFGYTVDGMPLPYDVAMAPYAAAAAAYRTGVATYAGGGGAGANMLYAGNEASLPLLSESCGFNGDMVFANRQVRHAFIRKVLGLLTVQLLLTAAVAMPILIKKHVRRFLHANPWVFFLALVVTATLLLVLACSEAARRRHPTNLLLLAGFTLAQGALIGTASATYATNGPIVGVLITAAVCLALIVYALQTSVDFSASGGMLYSALVVLLVVSLAEHFLGFNTLHLLVGGCGALLFCAYLVFDLQLLASGESKYAVSADEYVFGVCSVYTDIINMFLFVIEAVSHVRGADEDIH